MKAGAVVVLAAVCLGLVGMTIAAPLHHSEETDEFLAQIRLIATDLATTSGEQNRTTSAETALPAGPSELVVSLKEKLTKEIESIQVVDNSDRANLPDEISGWEHTIAAIDNNITTINQTIASNNGKLVGLRAQCDANEKTAATRKSELDTWENKMTQHNAVFAEERAKYQAALDAITADLDLIKLVESQLKSAVEDKASEIGTSAQPLQNQANSLIASLREEMDEAKRNADNEWAFTQSRLDITKQPTAAALAAATTNYQAAQSAVQQCVISVNVTMQQQHTLETQLNGLLKTRTDAVTSKDLVKSSFETRHVAREKRIAYLTNLLDKFEQLGGEVYSNGLKGASALLP